MLNGKPPALTFSEYPAIRATGQQRKWSMRLVSYGGVEIFWTRDLVPQRPLGSHGAQVDGPGRGVHSQHVTQSGHSTAADGDDGGEDAANDADELGRLPHHATEQSLFLANRAARPDTNRDLAFSC